MAYKIIKQFESLGEQFWTNRPSCMPPLAVYFLGTLPMKKIKLTRGQFALVDDKDFEWLNQWKWYALKGKTTYYAARFVGGRKNRKMILGLRVFGGLRIEKNG